MVTGRPSNDGTRVSYSVLPPFFYYILVDVMLEFVKDCPSGILSKEEFAKSFKQFCPSGNPSSFAD